MRRIDAALLAALVAINVILAAATLGRVQALQARIDGLEAREPATITVVIPDRKAEPATEPERQSAQFTAYAYCKCSRCCGEWSKYGLTATGTVPQAGRTVAVDPAVIPLGTELWIDGEGGFVAEDTGGGIDGYTLDVYHDSHQAAREYGVRTVTVTWR